MVVLEYLIMALLLINKGKIYIRSMIYVREVHTTADRAA